MDTIIRNKINELQEKTVAMRRDLHKHAESGWTEFRTSSIAIGKMKALGYNITMGELAMKKSEMMGVPSDEELVEHQSRAISQGADKTLVDQMTGGLTAFWADMKFTDDPIRVALRFDMDSNDVTECADPTQHRPAKEGFASINKAVMHACGHDGHVAVGLAIAEIVVTLKDKLKGSIRFIFQPSEEGLRGAGPMVSAGCCDNVDYILGMHLGFQASKKGDLICGAKGFLASTKWDVEFKGRAAHAGAYPEEGKNALLAAATASINLHAISRHGSGVTRINVGKLVAGEGRNVIPPNALLIMETRGLTSDLDDYMTQESERIIKAAALMYDCEYSIKVVGGTKSGESSPEMIDIVYDIAKTIPAYSNVVKIKDFGAGEDYSHMMTYVQKHGGIGTYIQVGIDKTAGHHNNLFDFDEEDMFPAIELNAKIITAILGK